MSVLIFRLNGVDEEEAGEVRELLHKHRLAYYETSAGRWGLSVAAIWLIDETQKERAADLLLDYEQQRQRRVREDYRLAHPTGSGPGILDRAKQAPTRALGILLAIVRWKK